MDESTRECDVEGCTKPPRTRTSPLCNAHYFQRYRNGKITSAQVKERRTGCKEPGCDKPHEALGWCNMHHTRWQRHGDPQAIAVRVLPVGPDHHAWRGMEAGYGTSHDRVKRLLGSASEYACHHCGGQARHWAYDHGDPGERVDPRGIAYSTKPEHYQPLCVSCHKRFDLDHIAARNA